ncbi:MAG: hypothetical protein L6R42_003411 [Xanthoria sp. 1 TBL-2021]|nr:MAG: hypothetical protein L6R42_003411 [Xanthoria sp. 1 TBL-2021]
MDVVASLPMQLPLRKARRLQGSAKPADNKSATGYVKWGKPSVPTKEKFADELQSLYWGGVRRELAQMILTLQEWQQPQYSTLELEEESNSQVEGYDHFVDQVSESSREFARKERLRRLRAGTRGDKDERTYEDCAQAVLTACRTGHADQRLKKEIKRLMPDRRDENIVERRARMLLQSASFLDIDKVITYNSPLPQANFWRRSAPPQLTLARFDESSMPKLKALRCKACGDVVRGILFKCLEPKCQAAIPLNQMDSICETCFRGSRHPQSHMTKFYKHLILRDIITPRISREICVCDPTTHTAPKIRHLPPFPIDDKFLHRGKGKLKVLKCGLLLLSDRVMEAKYQGTISAIEKRKRQVQTRKQIKPDDGTKVQSTTPRLKGLRRRQTKSQGQRYTDPQGKVGEKTMSDVEEEELASKEIPLLYRKFTNRYPFGNVHVALMFGPLVIENGVPE